MKCYFCRLNVVVIVRDRIDFLTGTVHNVIVRNMLSVSFEQIRFFNLGFQSIDFPENSLLNAYGKNIMLTILKDM